MKFKSPVELKKHLFPGFLVLAWALTIPQLVQAIGSARKVEPSAKSASSAVAAPANAEKVWVVRPDGGQGCSIDKAQTLTDGEKSLTQAGITTFGSRKGKDGLMHALGCGESTGGLNGYLIRKEDLQRAIALGFKTAPLGFGN